MKWFREQLAKIAANPTELLKLAPAACQAHLASQALSDDGAFVLRDNGVALSKSRRDELLAKCAANEYVELEVDMLAYEQVTGARNRNSVRFRDGLMMSLGSSGKDTPFLRDHRQGDVTCRAGTVLSSKTEKRGEGDYVIRQTVKLTAPWAVELALRGLLGSVSIGWNPTGPVNCSACDAPIFTKCWHCPGDTLSEKDIEGGGKRKVRDALGPITVEWIFTAAELIETSMVNVGGVPSARADDIRASLSASLSTHQSSPRDGREDLFHGEFPEETDDMDPKLLALLGLPATATLSEVLAAIAKRDATGAADSAELADGARNRGRGSAKEGGGRVHHGRARHRSDRQGRRGAVA